MWIILATIATINLWHPVLWIALVAGFLIHLGGSMLWLKSRHIEHLGAAVWLAFIGFSFQAVVWHRALILVAVSLAITQAFKAPIQIAMYALQRKEFDRVNGEMQ